MPCIKVQSEKSLNTLNKEILDEIVKYAEDCLRVRQEAITLKTECMKMEQNYNNCFDLWIRELQKRPDFDLKLL